MSRKDYILIAQSIGSLYPVLNDDNTIIRIAEHIGNDLRFTNPNFNLSRFITAVKNELRRYS